MAKVYLICGKICVGKTTYSEGLRREKDAVLLSTDEITLALFPEGVGEKHDLYVERTQDYLLEKSLEIIEVGVNVILDWGFWMREERDFAREFFTSRGVECEFYYIDISDDEWRRRLEKRNAAVANGEVSAYFVDEGLAKKFGAIFEPPTEDEIDVWIYV